MSLYGDAKFPVRTALSSAHAAALSSFTQPGTWWNGAERATLVEIARNARCEEGLQETEDGNRNGPLTDMPDVARRVARQIAISVKNLNRGFLDNALAGGLSDAEYVEIIGLVSRAVSVDTFARGIGVPIRALPAVVAGEPTRQRPSTARAEKAWTETVPGGRRGGEDAKYIYGSNEVQHAPYIYRALSLVPEEARGQIEIAGAQYLGIDDFMDLGFTFEPEISRVQVELLAARVSAHNQCFY